MTSFAKGDRVWVNMPGLPLHEKRGELKERPGIKIARVVLDNGQERLIPTKRLKKA